MINTQPIYQYNPTSFQLHSIFSPHFRSFHLLVEFTETVAHTHTQIQCPTKSKTNRTPRGEKTETLITTTTKIKTKPQRLQLCALVRTECNAENEHAHSKRNVLQCLIGEYLAMCRHYHVQLMLQFCYTVSRLGIFVLLFVFFYRCDCMRVFLSNVQSLRVRLFRLSCSLEANLLVESVASVCIAIGTTNRKYDDNTARSVWKRQRRTDQLMYIATHTHTEACRHIGNHKTSCLSRSSCDVNNGSWQHYTAALL